MRPSRLQAVENIELNVPPGLDDQLRWFYGDVAGLKEHVSDRFATPELCFRSERIQLRIRTARNPVIDTVATRMTLRVKSLSEVAEVFDERKIDYVRFSGLAYTDRSIVVQDPAGYRVEFRQFWPEGPF